MIKFSDLGFQTNSRWKEFVVICFSNVKTIIGKYFKI